MTFSSRSRSSLEALGPSLAGQRRRGLRGAEAQAAQLPPPASGQDVLAYLKKLGVDSSAIVAVEEAGEKATEAGEKSAPTAQSARWRAQSLKTKLAKLERSEGQRDREAARGLGRRACD
eukprot:7532092-Pyramimonas_sp.AAC.1